MIPLVLAAALAAEPPVVGRPFEARPRRAWDVVDTALDLKVDPAARRLEGRVVHRVAPLGLPDDALRLHAEALTIHDVTVDGLPVTWRVREDGVEIPLAPGVPHEVALTWEASPETGVHFRDGKGPATLEAWTQNEDEDGRYWFPTWDHPSDAFPVSIALTVPSALHAVANGVLQGKDEVAPGWTRWRYRLDQPIVSYLVAFAVGEHVVVPLDGPVPMEIVAPAGTPVDVARRHMDRAPAIAAFLGTLLDEPYPYPVYRQVLVQRFLYGGMENATLTILADDLLDAGGELQERSESVVAHELAHQWFGDLLTCHGWRELWLNEGFATFHAARWDEVEHGEGAYAAHVLGWSDDAVGTTAPLSRRDWVGADTGPYTHEYDRGAIVLHMLRAWLGDATFDAAIRRYVDDHRFGLVETDDLRQAFEAVTGNELRWWFDRWVHGWGAPTLATSWSDDGGRLRVAVVQDGPTPWEGPVTLDWADAAGPHRAELWLAGGATTFEVPSEAPRWVIVDPVGGLLAHWTRAQPALAWATALSEAPTAYARLLAARALGDVTDAQDVAAAALAAALLRPDPGAGAGDHVAREAAAALGRLGTPIARDALVATLSGGGSFALRAAAASALAGFPLDPGAAAALERAVQRADSPTVAAAALHALGAAWPSRARPAALRALDTPDRTRMGVVHAAALDVLGGSRDAGMIDAALARVGDARRAVRHAAGSAVAELGRREEVPAARRARLAQALAPWLDDEDQRTRGLALWLLVRLGAPEAIPALQAFAARTTIEDDRVRARDAVTWLRGHAEPGKEDPDALLKAQASLEALEAEVNALQGRLEHLEAR